MKCKIFETCEKYTGFRFCTFHVVEQILSNPLLTNIKYIIGIQVELVGFSRQHTSSF